MRGYDLYKHKIVEVKVKRYEFNKLKSALKMLSAGRIDFILDYSTAIEKNVKELGLSDKVEIVPDVIVGPKYYMIFADTKKGEKLARVWDEGMEKLFKSGKLHKMYAQCKDWAY